MSEQSPNERHLRRSEAARYVVETHNVPCSPKTLAKLACVSSNGPPFRLAGRFPLYPTSGLDAWGACSKIGLRAGPLNVRSPDNFATVKMKTRRLDFLGGISEHTGLTIGNRNVKRHSKSEQELQGLSSLPLFEWRAEVRRPATRAGRYIGARFPVPAGHADLIAALAGIGSGVDA